MNGTRTEYFDPSRGIRQGDPISLYVFILFIKVLSHNINQLGKYGKWAPIQISRNESRISHLLFVDDLVLMSENKATSCRLINETLQNFSSWSVQTINKQESKIVFSKSCLGNTMADTSNFF